METDKRITPALAFFASPTRLEGMETFVGFFNKIRLNMSPTRLEGMETYLAQHIEQLRNESPTRLEGMETSIGDYGNG